MAEETLLIDRAAAAERPGPEAVADWAAQQRVFVSSVIEGYGDRREAAVAAIEAIGASAVWFERFGGRDSDPNQAYLDEVRSSDIYVGLLGERYGRPLPSRFSATHEEYREAEQQGLRLSIWAEQGVDREGHQQTFLDEVRQFNVTGNFSSPQELEQELGRRLTEIAAEELSPWCKLGRVVFSICGEQNPLGLMSGEAEIPNPLGAVVAAGVSAEALRAVCELALTEVLVTQRGAARVLRLRLGADFAGQRAFRLEYQPGSQYGQPAAPRMVQGQVQL